ncbi:hypothetical protein BSKO_05116 [Bryopsis sp. KO-2023]|nr:hypothetical protein BSKO_05116 [Bryopsis sp. KO-2023]
MDRKDVPMRTSGWVCAQEAPQPKGNSSTQRVVGVRWTRFLNSVVKEFFEFKLPLEISMHRSKSIISNHKNFYSLSMHLPCDKVPVYSLQDECSELCSDGDPEKKRRIGKSTDSHSPS